MSFEWVPFTDLLSKIVDNRGRSCPVGKSGIPLIATNCIDRSNLYPSYETTRFVSEETYKTWFRGHPEPGDILFVCKGSPGRTNWVPDPVDFCIAQDMVAVRANPKKVDPKYLFAALRSPTVQSQIDNMHVGTMIPHFKKGDFGKLNIPVPSLVVQQEIGDLYFALTQRISELRETNATLEAIAQALFKSWFVDFDPVRAKMEGRTPEGMDEATAALFPDGFEESELGLVPRGWGIDSLTSIASVTMGLSPKGESYNANGVGTPLVNGPVEFGDYFPVKSKWTTAADKFAQAGDLIFCVRGSTTGRRVVSDGDYCVGRGVCAIRALHGHKSFLYQTINFGIDRLLSQTTGSVFPSLSGPDIRNFSVLRPVNAVIDAYEKATSSLLGRVEQGQLQAQTLATLRDTLLPRLISGQLRLPDTALQIQETAT